MGEFKPRNPDIDLLYRGEKSISDSIKRNTKAIKNIDLSEVNVEVNTDSISDAIHESATANTDALEGVAGSIQNVQRFIDYSEKLEEIVNAISSLNYGEELQIEINEVEDVIEQIIEDFQKLKSDYEETTEETLGDITLLNENYNNLLLNFTNLTEMVNSIIEKIGNIPTDISEELEEIKEEIEKLKSKIENIPDNVSEELEEIKSQINNLLNLKMETYSLYDSLDDSHTLDGSGTISLDISNLVYNKILSVFVQVCYFGYEMSVIDSLYNSSLLVDSYYQDKNGILCINYKETTSIQQLEKNMIDYSIFILYI